MPSVWTTINLAARRAVNVFRETITNPLDTAKDIDNRSKVYDILWDYYTNRALEDLAKYEPYLSTFRLYRNTRLIYNPVARLVNFYAGQVYPGILFPVEGQSFPEAIPLVDIEEPLELAIRQTWKWSNWQARKSRYVRVGALTGNVLVTIIDEPDRSKLFFEIVWPGLVDEIELDVADNVVSYSLQYPVRDSEGNTFTYRKEVDQSEIRTYRDGAPEGFGGNPAIYPNPYGFVPAIWAKHQDTGTAFGAPALSGTLGKIDNLNAMAAHIHDHMHKQIEMPQVISADGPISFALKPDEAATNGVDKNQARLLLKTVGGATVHDLAGNLNIDHSYQYITGMMEEIERDHPELSFWSQMREMTQVTGPGASRLMGDVQNRVWEAAANYDQQSIKLFQMAVAIAGWRLNNGDWEDNRQTEIFSDFDLESYAANDLDFGIAPRPLVPMNEEEMIALRSTRATYATSLTQVLSREDVLIEAGFDEERRAEILGREPLMPSIQPQVDSGDGNGDNNAGGNAR